MNLTPEQKARLDIDHGFADYLPFVSMITGMETRFINGLDSVMTNPDIAVTGEVEVPESGVEAAGAGPERSPQRSSGSPFARPLPHVRVGCISGLLELVAEKRDGDGSIPQLAQRLQLEVDDLLSLLDAAVLLDFATTTILRSKDLFR